MKPKYIPVLRNRKAEIYALSNQHISLKIWPLIEIVKPKMMVTSRMNFPEAYEELFRSIKSPKLIDIPMYLRLPKNTRQDVANFLTPIYNNPKMRLDYLKSLSRLKSLNIIPVVSYKPYDSYTDGFISTEVSELKSYFKQLAFRLLLTDLRDSLQKDNIFKALKEIEKLISKNDLLLLDIFEEDAEDDRLNSIYSYINKIKATVKCATALIKSSLPSSLKNTKLEDGIPIKNIVNTLISSHLNYCFDAFGDSAGIKRGEILDIPVSSPGYIHFNQRDNNFVGFKGIFKKTSTFSSMVLPNYTGSSYWKTIPAKHKNECKGCQIVKAMLVNPYKIKPNDPTKWKTVSIAHYIRSMDEVICLKLENN